MHHSDDSIWHMGIPGLDEMRLRLRDTIMKILHSVLVTTLCTLFVAAGAMAQYSGVYRDGAGAEHLRGSVLSSGKGWST